MLNGPRETLQGTTSTISQLVCPGFNFPKRHRPHVLRSLNPYSYLLTPSHPSFEIALHTFCFWALEVVSNTNLREPEIYGDTAQFTREGNKFLAMTIGFPLHKIKGSIIVVFNIPDLLLTFCRVTLANFSM